jgi:demethylmenaquinone methyltransferase/2-methoxy-6-polyprenyl-1,4-benzoquinol methylase
MLNHGISRAARHADLGDRLQWLCANAEALPFEDASVDAYTIAFGIRNVSDIGAALREAKRVLRRGGRFLCLEFSTVTIPGLARLYDTYSSAVLPRLGEWVAGDRAAYDYLVESIRRFPSQEDFKSLIGEAGFQQVTVRNLSGGIAAMHSAWA